MQAGLSRTLGSVNAASQLNSHRLFVNRSLLPLGTAASKRHIHAHVTPAEKPFLLHTAGTPNGRKVSVYLEELKAAYGVQYE
jgi:hypothetical protein